MQCRLGHIATELVRLQRRASRRHMRAECVWHRVQGRNDSSTSAGGQSSSVAASSVEQGSGGQEIKADQDGGLLEEPKQVDPCPASVAMLWALNHPCTCL